MHHAFFLTFLCRQCVCTTTTWFVTSSLVFLFTFLWRRFKRLVARGDVNSRCFSERCSNWTLNPRFKIILCMCSATSFHSCRYFVCCINSLRCTNGKLLQVRLAKQQLCVTCITLFFLHFFAVNAYARLQRGSSLPLSYSSLPFFGEDSLFFVYGNTRQ